MTLTPTNAYSEGANIKNYNCDEKLSRLFHVRVRPSECGLSPKCSVIGTRASSCGQSQPRNLPSLVTMSATCFVSPAQPGKERTTSGGRKVSDTSTSPSRTEGIGNVATQTNAPFWDGIGYTRPPQQYYLK